MSVADLQKGGRSDRVDGQLDFDARVAQPLSQASSNKYKCRMLSSSNTYSIEHDKAEARCIQFELQLPSDEPLQNAFTMRLL